jgi:hypothetical protein
MPTTDKAIVPNTGSPALSMIQDCQPERSPGISRGFEGRPHPGRSCFHRECGRAQIPTKLTVASQNRCANLPPNVCENGLEPYSRFQPVLPSNRPTARRNAHAACADRRDFARRSAAPVTPMPWDLRFGSPHQSPGNTAPDETMAVAIDRFAPAKSRRQAR